MAEARTGCGPTSRKTSNPSFASSAIFRGIGQRSPPWPGGDPRRVLQAQVPVEIRRRDFADAVADEPVRDDSPRFPQRRQCRPGGRTGSLDPPRVRRAATRARRRSARPPATSRDGDVRIASHRSIAARKAGSRSEQRAAGAAARGRLHRRRRRPVSERRPGSLRPCTMLQCGSPRRKESRASMASSRLETTSASRWS